MRAAFTAAQGLPSADPWRHLLLLQNLREGRGFTLFELLVVLMIVRPQGLFGTKRVEVV